MSIFSLRSVRGTAVSRVNLSTYFDQSNSWDREHGALHEMHECYTKYQLNCVLGHNSQAFGLITLFQGVAFVDPL